MDKNIGGNLFKYQITKDLEVPFVPSKTCAIQIPYEHHTIWLS